MDPGDPCDLVTVPTRQGLEAVDILRRGSSDAVGPVLHDDSCDTLGFLVPPGTADAWDVPGSTCTQTDGRGVSLVAEAAASEDAGAGSGEPPSRAPTGSCLRRTPSSPRTRSCCGRRWMRRLA